MILFSKINKIFSFFLASFSVKGIRELSPKGHSSDEFVSPEVNSRKPKKNWTSKDVLEFQFNSVVQLEGVPSAVMDSSK